MASNPLYGNNQSMLYTYGIDPQGKMYIYDKLNNKMVYYGDPSNGVARIYAYQNDGATARFEGDRSGQKSAQAGAAATSTPSNVSVAGGGGGGYSAPAKVLDQAAIDSLQSLLGTIDSDREVAKRKAAITRDTNLREKQDEKKRETDKYSGKKLTTLQDFAEAKTDTDINTRNTLENLISSLSTMGLGGSRALTRQILDAANMSNRKANATQATNNQSLDSAYNEFTAGNENDMKKIQDQYGYDVGEADRKWGQDRQNTLYKMGDVYNAGGDDASRSRVMGEGNNLNAFISNAAFLNPQYTGTTRQMATPDLSNYTQDIAKYDTGGIGTGGNGTLTPVSAGDGATGAGNLAIRAVAVNDKDLGIKKKTEAELGYGV